jgi:hypothetical protein
MHPAPRGQVNTEAVLAVAGFEEKLEKALSIGGYPSYSLGDLLERLADNRAQIFRSEEAVLVTEILESKKGRVLNIWLTAGELEAAMDLSRQAVSAAEGIGCVAATFTGRRGWGKIPAVAEDGWKPTATIFSKSLGG